MALDFRPASLRFYHREVRGRNPHVVKNVLGHKLTASCGTNEYKRTYHAYCRHHAGGFSHVFVRDGKSAIGNILALGGDRPHDIPYDKSQDSFQHAIDLVKFIRRFNESGAQPDHRGFGIGVAGFPEGHPATPNRLVEMDYFKAK